MKGHDSVKREVSYIILIESDTLTKIVRLIKMCLNESANMLMSRHQNKMQNHNINVANGFSKKNVIKLKYLGKTETNLNFIYEYIKS